MAYPTSIKSFTFKRNNIDKVVADDVNTAYTEITEIERQLGGITTTSGGLAGVGVVKSDWGTGTFSTSISNWYSNDGLGARLKNIEAGLYQALVTGSILGTTIPTSSTLLTSSTTSLPSITSVNGTTIPSSQTLLTTTSGTTSILTKVGALSGGTAGYVKVDASGNLTSETVPAKATNIAGGTGSYPKLVKQTAADTTTFIDPGTTGYVLYQGFAGPSWDYKIPYDIKSGTTTTSSASVSVAFTTAFTQVPIVTATLAHSSGAIPTVPEVLVIYNVTANGFDAYIWTGTVASPSTWTANSASRKFNWIAVQYSPSNGSNNP